MGYLHGFQILVLVFWASIFALHRVQCSSAFVSPSHSRCDVNVFVDSYSQFCENRRICVVCWAQSGHAANNRERFPERWFPDHLIQTAGCEEGKNTDAVKEAAEGESLRLIARLVSQGLRPDDAKEPPVAQKNRKAYELAKGKFVDLCCTLDGEKTLESLFDDEEASNENTHIIQGAIISLQSLAILGMQFGVKATAEQFERSVSHLIETRDNLEMERDYVDWDSTSTRRLKYRSERTPGLQLLSTLLRKRSAQGAYDLLVKLNAWKKHEDLALLRSGFSMRFSGKELRAAEKVSAESML